MFSLSLVSTMDRWLLPSDSKESQKSSDINDMAYIIF